MTLKYSKFFRIVLGWLLFIISLNAFGGGYYGMAGAEDVPPEWLEGSPFRNYLVPSIILFLVIGGSCFAASILVWKNHVYARRASGLSGVLLLTWICIQLMIIGYVSWLQPAIILSALLILYLSSEKIFTSNV